jgi:site-specific recombinase XerD
MLGDRPPEPLEPSEVRALLAACGGRTLTATRNRALLAVLWRAGLRCSEALALRPSDVSFANGTVRVLHGKGNKARTVGIDSTALTFVQTWLDRRKAAGFADGAALFCVIKGPTRGGPMHPRAVRAMVGRLGARAGIQHRVHPHGLRHTMAVELVREGVPVTLISRQLGHSSIATTAVYLDHLHPREAIEMARSRTWD